MADTVLEQITQEVYDRLDALTTAGLGEFTYSEVVRPTVRGGDFSPHHLQIVLTCGNLERQEDLDCPGNPPASAYRQTFNIRCRISPSESATESADYFSNIIHGDVVKALTNAGNQWYTFGGLAFDANFGTPEAVQDPDGSFDGIAILLDVTFRTDENNPFNVRS